MNYVAGGSRRVPAIDIARAIIIIGVVFSHSVDGLANAGILGESSPVIVANEALYIFRMPALAFLLGLFIPGGIAKRGTRGYIRERATLSLYLYVVWFFIQTLAEIATSNVKNTPRGWGDLLSIWSMPAHLWFLPYLALSAIVVAALLTLRWTQARVVALALIGVLAVVCWGNNPPVFGLRGLSLLVFTLAGAMIGLRRLSSTLANSPSWWLIAGSAATALFVPLFSVGLVPSTINRGDHFGLVPSTINRGDHSALISVLSMLGAMLGLVAALGLSVALSYVPAFWWLLEKVGQRTLPIYLAHVALVAGVRIGLDRLGIAHAWMLIVASLVLAVGLPMVAASVAPRLRMGWIFEPPAKLQCWSRAAFRTAAQTRR